ncbi:pyridoxal phosphate-dependent transferase [Geopyxis carbonaria]|nr:pyridoxal phosphate-dependent transferase [Geopyxis carbonaria]
MEYLSSIPHDAKTYLSFRGVDLLKEETEPNPDWETKPGHRFSFEEYEHHVKANDLIDLSSAENTLMTQDLKDHISRNFATTLTDQDFQYGGLGGSDRLRGLLAKFINNHWHLNSEPRKAKGALVKEIVPDNIVTTPGVYAALEHLSYAIANPGDGILIGRPLYGGFSKGFTFSRSRVKVVSVDFTNDRDELEIDAFSEDVIDRYRRAWERSNEDGTRIKAILICNPHNPLGRCFERHVIEKLIDLCCELNIHLISDEIYAMTHYERFPGDTGSTPFTSVLGIPNRNKNQDNLVHSLYGMSKDFCCSGVRLGAIITRSSAICNVVMTNSFMSWVSSGADIIWSCILADNKFLQHFFSTTRKKLGHAYQTMTAEFKRHGINYYSEGNAGLFIWIDLTYALEKPMPVKSTDASREKFITDKLNPGTGGLKISSGRAYKTEEIGWFRIVFSREDEVVIEAVNRIVNLIGTPKNPKK